MQDDRLAQSQRIYFNQAESLFPMARGFFRWPSISAQPSSAVISNAFYFPVLLIYFICTSGRGYNHMLSDSAA